MEPFSKRKISTIHVPTVVDMLFDRGLAEQLPLMSYCMLSTIVDWIYNNECPVQVVGDRIYYRLNTAYVLDWIVSWNEMSREDAKGWLSNAIRNFTKYLSSEMYENLPETIWVSPEKDIIKCTNIDFYNRYYSNNNVGWVYCFYNERTGLTKIGRSEDFIKRKKSVENSTGMKLHLVCAIRCNNYYNCEKMLHKHFATCREKGEWFQIDNDVRKDIINTFVTVAHNSGSYTHDWRFAE